MNYTLRYLTPAHWQLPPQRAMRTLLCAAAIAAAVAGGVAAADGGSRAQPPSIGVRQTGDIVVVFHTSSQGCERDDIPDAPARALRLADGSVAMIAANQKNRVLRGPNLLSLRPDCTVVLTGRWDADPAAYDDRLWLASTWTGDGTNVIALVHSEYQGNNHPDQCPSGRYIDCWYNAITLAISHDSAHSFTRASGGAALIASIPYRYDRQADRHVGYFNPSNLVEHDGALYAMMWATQYREQALGNCLIRTEYPDAATSWRAWDGSAFAVQFIDPYHSNAPPTEHVCPAVERDHLRGPVVSLVRHTPSGAYIALFVGGHPTGDAQLPWAVFSSGSWDLIHWSSPLMVMPVARFDTDVCSASAPLAYPSLLDPDSPSVNFDTVGNTAQLYLARFNLDRCHTSLDRDLIRIPVSLMINPS
jgi:hypothetical protein